MTDIPRDALNRMAAARISSATRKKNVRLRGIAIPRDWLSAQRRTCPQCLAESAYHRAVWDVVHFRVCSIHSCELIASCPGCGQRLGWSSSDLRRCTCSADLARRESPSGDPAAARWIGGVFLGDGSPPPKLLAHVPFVPAVTVLTLLEAAFLGCVARDLLDPFGPRTSEGQAFAYQALDGNVDHLRQALIATEDKPRGRLFRIARTAVIQMSMLCAATLGLRAVGAAVDAHLAIPVPIMEDPRL